MAETQKKFLKSFFAMAVAVILSLIPFMTINIAYADNSSAETVANVMEDLQKDENFDASIYPVNHNDHSLKVMQIAEGSEKELFVYVYQPDSPNVDLVATSINISTTIDETLNYKNYKLSLVSDSDVFYKYQVKDFTVSTDPERYYDISSIFRSWNEKYDKKPEGDNTVNEISFEVGQLWTAMTKDGQVYYSNTSTETILVTDKYVGFLRYSNGFKFFPDDCRSHYVAFSTDKEIDKLLEAEVYYISQSYHCVTTGIGTMNPTQKVTYGEKENKYVQLKYTDVASNPADGFLAKKYKWNRIESVSEFVAKEELKDEAKSNLENKQWILRFAETKNTWSMDVRIIEDYTIISDVTILRLKFETNGIVYNLGVVDNKQTGGPISDNIQHNVFQDLWAWLVKFWKSLSEIAKAFVIIALVVIGVLILCVIYRILKAVWDFLKNTFSR